MGQLFYAPSSIVHNFVTISNLKLELRSGKNWGKICFDLRDLDL